MKRTMKLTAGLLFAFLLAFALGACGGSGGEAEEPQGENGQYTNEGMTMTIPEEYRDVVTVDTPEKDEDGVLFVVSETASIEAAKAQDEDPEGAGWLFSISRITEDQLHEQLGGDMSGAEEFARDEDGNVYMYLHPTDVRLIRANNEEMEAAMDEWTKLNEWAATMPEAFIAENEGLTPETHGNTELDIYLARIAYDGNGDYTISTTEFGPKEPGNVKPDEYIDPLLHDVVFEEKEGMEAPDGEYVVLTFPEDQTRFDFFKAEGSENVIRMVRGEGEDETEVFYQATFADDSTKATEVMQKWYDALVKGE